MEEVPGMSGRQQMLAGQSFRAFRDELLATYIDMFIKVFKYECFHIKEPDSFKKEKLEDNILRKAGD